MTKPIAYYLSDPLDSGTIAEIAVTYGDRLEGLDRAQKLCLLHQISELLLNADEDAVLPDWLSDRLESLQNDTLLGLLTATVEQLRHGE